SASDSQDGVDSQGTDGSAVRDYQARTNEIHEAQREADRLAREAQTEAQRQQAFDAQQRADQLRADRDQALRDQIENNRIESLRQQRLEQEARNLSEQNRMQVLENARQDT